MCIYIYIYIYISYANGQNRNPLTALFFVCNKIFSKWAWPARPYSPRLFNKNNYIKILVICGSVKIGNSKLLVLNLNFLLKS